MKQATKEEKIRRIRVIQEYLLEGQNTADILSTIMTNYKLGLRSAQMYLKKARELFIEINNKSIQESFAEHISARRRLIKKYERSNPKLALDCWKDLALLEGLYTIGKNMNEDVNDKKDSCEFVMPGGQVLKI